MTDLFADQPMFSEIETVTAEQLAIERGHNAITIEDMQDATEMAKRWNKHRQELGLPLWD